MADKKLSSVDVVNDMAFIYAETSDGKTVKISKADLASVAAELIGVDSFIFKTISHNGIAPSSIEVGPFQGFLLYRRSYATYELTTVAIDTKSSAKILMSGRSDFLNDFVFRDGKLYLEGSGSYWGGIFVSIIGSKI